MWVMQDIACSDKNLIGFAHKLSCKGGVTPPLNPPQKRTKNSHNGTTRETVR